MNDSDIAAVKAGVEAHANRVALRNATAPTLADELRRLLWLADDGNLLGEPHLSIHCTDVTMAKAMGELLGVEVRELSNGSWYGADYDSPLNLCILWTYEDDSQDEPVAPPCGDPICEDTHDDYHRSVAPDAYTRTGVALGELRDV